MFFSTFLNTVGKFISQENLLVAAANSCKVFQIFIPKKVYIQDQPGPQGIFLL